MRAPYRPRPVDRYATSIDDWREDGNCCSLLLLLLLDLIFAGTLVTDFDSLIVAWLVCELWLMKYLLLYKLANKCSMLQGFNEHLFYWNMMKYSWVSDVECLNTDLWKKIMIDTYCNIQKKEEKHIIFLQLQRRLLQPALTVRVINDKLDMYLI